MWAFRRVFDRWHGYCNGKAMPEHTSSGLLNRDLRGILNELERQVAALEEQATLADTDDWLRIQARKTVLISQIERLNMEPGPSENSGVQPT